MAKKRTTPAKAGDPMTPVVAATLAGVIYQARLSNRESKLNIPDSEVIADVVGLWRTLLDELREK